MIKKIKKKIFKYLHSQFHKKIMEMIGGLLAWLILYLDNILTVSTSLLVNSTHYILPSILLANGVGIVFGLNVVGVFLLVYAILMLYAIIREVGVQQ